MRRRELRVYRGRHQVGVQGAVPFLARRRQPAVRVLARVVDQDVQPAEARQRGVDAALDLAVLSDVGLAEQGAPVQLLSERLARLSVAPDQHHVHAGRSQAARDIGAQALRAAGDDGGFAGQAGKA
ncbi:hypothetical protein G6F31_019812 [Rhizopus arrhizus]|nr:hypothetical protein G6F31_019812 [Rhizopus arrhizus]